jgi:hypothetical protein
MQLAELTSRLIVLQSEVTQAAPFPAKSDYGRDLPVSISAIMALRPQFQPNWTF